MHGQCAATPEHLAHTAEDRVADFPYLDSRTYRVDFAGEVSGTKGNRCSIISLW
jgi:hypothetical protein